LITSSNLVGCLDRDVGDFDTAEELDEPPDHYL
jgi:hypothetical protein